MGMHSKFCGTVRFENLCGLMSLADYPKIDIYMYSFQ